MSGWDREDNRQQESEVALDGTLRLSSDPIFSCQHHGETSNVITFTIDGNTTNFCTACLHAALIRHFEPLERINE